VVLVPKPGAEISNYFNINISLSYFGNQLLTGFHFSTAVLKLNYKMKVISVGMKKISARLCGYHFESMVAGEYRINILCSGKLYNISNVLVKDF
jgi:hypothetical protein